MKDAGCQTIPTKNLVNISERISEEEDTSIDQKRGQRLSLLLNDEINESSFIGGSDNTAMNKKEAKELEDSLRALETTVQLKDDDTIRKVQEQLVKRQGDMKLRTKEVKLLRNFFDKNEHIHSKIASLNEEQKVLELERNEYEATVNENKTTLEGLEAKNRELQKQNMELVADKSGLNIEKETANANVKVLEEEQKKVGDDLQKKTDEQAATEEQLAEALGKLEEASTNLEKTCTKLDETMAELDQV